MNLHRATIAALGPAPTGTGITSTVPADPEAARAFAGALATLTGSAGTARRSTTPHEGSGPRSQSHEGANDRTRTGRRGTDASAAGQDPAADEVSPADPTTAGAPAAGVLPVGVLPTGALLAGSLPLPLAPAPATTAGDGLMATAGPGAATGTDPLATADPSLPAPRSGGGRRPTGSAPDPSDRAMVGPDALGTGPAPLVSPVPTATDPPSTVATQPTSAAAVTRTGSARPFDVPGPAATTTQPSGQSPATGAVPGAPVPAPTSATAAGTTPPDDPAQARSAPTELPRAGLTRGPSASDELGQPATGQDARTASPAAEIPARIIAAHGTQRPPQAPDPVTDRSVDQTFAPPPAAATAAPAPAAPAPAAPAPTSHVAGQLTEQLTHQVVRLRTLEDGTHRLVLRVTPDELGPVRVVAQVRGGTLQLELHATTAAGQAALSAAEPQVRADLAKVAPTATLDFGQANTGDSPDGRNMFQFSGSDPSGDFRDGRGRSAHTTSQPAADVPAPRRSPDQQPPSAVTGGTGHSLDVTT